MDFIQTLLIFVLLLMVSALFSASETAITGANRIRLKTQAESGDRSAKKALTLIESYDGTLSTLLIGNNIVNTLMASLGTVVCTKLFPGGSGVGIATLVVTILIILFGEVIPKSFANTSSEKVSKVMAAPLIVIKFIFTPIVFILDKIKKLILPKNLVSDPSVTEDELKVIIEEIEDEGVIEEEASELLQSALEFGDISVDEILTPRVDIFAVEQNATRQEIVDMFVEQRFSRLPIYQKTIDNIIGVVNQKDYFTKLVMGENPTLEHTMQPCLHVPPKKKISELMGELQRKKLHMAVVTDQYGGTVGIVTLEDILEELVGEIWDEHDEITYMVLPLGEDKYEVSGELLIEDLFETIDEEIKLPQADATTVAGLALEKMGKIPVCGERFLFAGYSFIITKVDEKRILKLQIEKATQAQENE